MPRRPVYSQTPSASKVKVKVKQTTSEPAPIDGLHGPHSAPVLQRLKRRLTFPDGNLHRLKLSTHRLVSTANPLVVILRRFNQPLQTSRNVLLTTVN